MYRVIINEIYLINVFKSFSDMQNGPSQGHREASLPNANSVRYLSDFVFSLFFHEYKSLKHLKS